ncbi:MAG: thiol peroxidase [Gilvibacter sp.]
MANITLGGTPTHTSGELPTVGQQAPNAVLTKTDMSSCSIQDFTGKNVVLNIFPSVDTGVCAQSIRTFNKEAAGMNNTAVLCISKDLPFAQQRFCGAEGIENVHMLSDYKTGEFGANYGATVMEGAFEGLLSRAVVVIDPQGKVAYTEQVPEIGQEPNYQAALAVI